MCRISTKQIKAKAAANGWKPFTGREWSQGIRPEKDFYYSTISAGVNGLAFFANDDNIYYIIGRNDLFFKVLDC